MEISVDENGNNVYIIKEMNDFHHIRVDKLENCLADFLLMLKTVRPTVYVFKIVAFQTDVPLSKIIELGPFKWVDDGFYGESQCKVSKIEVDGEKIGFRFENNDD